MRQPITIEHVKREVIERKLLTALQEEGNVAVILNKDDLDTLIAALLFAEGERRPMAKAYHWRELREGLERLRKEAF